MTMSFIHVAAYSFDPGQLDLSTQADLCQFFLLRLTLAQTNTCVCVCHALMWEKEILLVTSNFFVSYNIFIPFWRIFCHFHQIWNCRLQTSSVKFCCLVKHIFSTYPKTSLPENSQLSKKTDLTPYHTIQSFNDFEQE